MSQELVGLLRKLYRGYVILLETGRDRIRMHGGECDLVDVMEERDPLLREVRAALASNPQAVSPEVVEALERLDNDAGHPSVELFESDVFTICTALRNFIGRAGQ